MSYGSHTVVVTGGNAVPALGQTTPPVVSAITPTTCTVSWTAAAGAGSGYIVALNGQFVAIVNPPGLSVNLTGLTPSTTYQATVISLGPGIPNPQSPPSQATTFSTASSITITTTSPLPQAAVGTPYSFTFQATGGTMPYTWSLVSQTGSNVWHLSGGGLLTGTPTVIEGDTVTVKVTDAASNTASGSFNVTVAVSLYTFQYFISATGNDSWDGLSPVFVSGTHGPWTVGSLRDGTGGGTGATPQQIANNNLMAGQVVGVVGPTPCTFSSGGFSYALNHGGTGNMLNLPSGTGPSTPTILASCNTSGQYVQGLGVIDGECNGTQISSFNLLGKFTVTANASDCQYITIDGLEVRNGMNGGIVLGQSAAIGNTSPGWVVKNCYVHHIYNCNEGFSATGCSQSGTTVNLPTITGGVVYVGSPGDQLLSGGLAGHIIAQVSGTPGGSGVYTSDTSATVTGPVNTTGSLFAGSNTAGISFHGGTGHIQTNNFIQDVIDLNTALPNNQRVDGIKNWTCINGNTSFNTIYASAATGYPTGGIEYKNVPQYNNVIANNYINLLNAANFTGVDVIAIAGDGEGSGVTVPNGHFDTINNNLIVANPHGLFGFPTVAGGPALSALIVNWYANTMIGGTGNGGFTRFGPAGTGNEILTYHDNIIDRVSPPAGGNGGDWRTTVNSVTLIDYNLWPANYLLTSAPSGGGSLTQYSASPPQNGGISGLMTALTTGSGGATLGLESNGGLGPEIGTPTYQNASGTKLKASDYKLAVGSVGYQTGRVGGVSGGAVVDKGAWGGQTQIGCNFRDPSG